MMDQTLLIDRRKLFEHVAGHLEAMILSGELRPGDRLPAERDLQARFGVGRPAIREALIALQKTGLVELANGARARVMMPTARHVFDGMAPAVRQMLSTKAGQRDFQRSRLFFEVGLAREAAREATPHDVAALARALDENAAAIGDRERFTATDIGFHLELARIARNPVLLALHDQISGWLAEQRTVTLAEPGQDATAHAAHETIFQGVAAHDPDAAEMAMRDHLQQLSQAYWRQRDQPPG